MALIIDGLQFVKETTETEGDLTPGSPAPALTLEGAVSGFESIVSKVGDGNEAVFFLRHNLAWMRFRGTVTSPDQLSVDEVLGSSDSGNPLVLGSGTKQVYCAMDEYVVVAAAATACGHFEYSSATECLFVPHKGNKVAINGIARTIPDAGVSFPNTSLAVDTKYYAYVFMSSGVMTKEWSTTAHAVEAGTGVEIKSGDATRTLVGMVYTKDNAGTPNFVDSESERHVASWFNSHEQISALSLGANVTTASTAWVEVSTTLRPSFLVWYGRRVLLMINGSTSNNTASTITLTGVSLASSGTPLASSNSTSPATNAPMPIGLMAVTYPTEGRHYASMLGSVNTGIGKWLSADTAAGESGKVTVLVMTNI